MEVTRHPTRPLALRATLRALSRPAELTPNGSSLLHHPDWLAHLRS